MSMVLVLTALAAAAAWGGIFGLRYLELRESQQARIAFAGIVLFVAMGGVIGEVTTQLEDAAPGWFVLTGRTARMTALYFAGLVLLAWSQHGERPRLSTVWTAITLMTALAWSVSWLSPWPSAGSTPLMVIAVLLAAGLLGHLRHSFVEGAARWVLLAVAILSGSAWLLGWEGASHAPLASSVGGIAGGRVSGLLSHPNTLGAVAGFALLVWMASPRPRFPIRLGALTASVATLGLSGSRTAWIATAAGLAFLAVYRALPTVYRKGASVAAIASGLVLTVGQLIWSLSNAPAVDIVLTGRLALWQLVLEDIATRPVVGHGSGYFTAVTERTGLEWASQAHNQILSSLVESGLLGLALLGVLVFALARCAVAGSSVSGGGSVSLLVFVLARSATEVPLRATQLGVAFLLLLLALTYITTAATDGTGASSPPGLAGEISGWRSKRFTAV
jgi:O-antigen ligase